MVWPYNSRYAVIIKTNLQGMVEGNRKRGRQKRTYIDKSKNGRRWILMLNWTKYRNAKNGAQHVSTPQH